MRARAFNMCLFIASWASASFRAKIAATMTACSSWTLRICSGVRFEAQASRHGMSDCEMRPEPFAYRDVELVPSRHGNRIVKRLILLGAELADPSDIVQSQKGQPLSAPCRLVASCVRQVRQPRPPSRRGTRRSAERRQASQPGPFSAWTSPAAAAHRSPTPCARRPVHRPLNARGASRTTGLDAPNMMASFDSGGSRSFTGKFPSAIIPTIFS